MAAEEEIKTVESVSASLINYSFLNKNIPAQNDLKVCCCSLKGHEESVAWRTRHMRSTKDAWQAWHGGRQYRNTMTDMTHDLKLITKETRNTFCKLYRSLKTKKANFDTEAVDSQTIRQ